MPHIISDIPILITCLVRKEFTQNFKRGHGEYLEAHILGLRCQEAHSLQFQVRFQDVEHGSAMFCLPIQALCWKPCELPCSNLIQPWDTFSSHFSAHQFGLLKNSRAFLLPNRIESRYLFTVDFEGNALADDFEQHKQLHVLQVSDGWFAAVPNNRVMMHDSAFGPLPETLPRFESLAANFCGEVDFHLPSNAPDTLQIGDSAPCECAK
jgi:hypothetical protein